MENRAPERTDSSSGSSGCPSARPAAVSIAVRCAEISAHMPVGSPPLSRKARQASVVTVNPGGTGRPSRVISARFDPLPPSRPAMSRLPSVKSYT
jgi:hypothetical protein